MPLPHNDLERLIDLWIEEDLGSGDVTSQALIGERDVLSANLNARQELVIAGLSIAALVFTKLDPGAVCKILMEDGKSATAGDCLMRVQGNARALLAAERTALNILQHLSGIATLTRSYVKAIEGTDTVLLDTRKTTPGLRLLEKHATLMGGAQNHRMGLYDAILIKDNHLAVAGTIEDAIKAARLAGFEKIEVECDTLDKWKDAIAANASHLLLDNMSLDKLAEAVAISNGRARLEASGGVTLETIHDIAKTGVDYISVGRITQSAPAVDIGMDYPD